MNLIYLSETISNRTCDQLISLWEIKILNLKTILDSFEFLTCIENTLEVFYISHILYFLFKRKFSRLMIISFSVTTMIMRYVISKHSTWSFLKVSFFESSYIRLLGISCLRIYNFFLVLENNSQFLYQLRNSFLILTPFIRTFHNKI